MHIRKKSSIIFLLIIVAFSIIGIIYFGRGSQNVKTSSGVRVSSNSNGIKNVKDNFKTEADDVTINPNYVIRIGDKNITVSKKKWKFTENQFEKTNYSKNYVALSKKDGEMFPQVVTVFLNKITNDRTVGMEKIADSEYIKAFVLYPYSITVRIIIDKKDYWVLSRQTFKSKNNYPLESDVSYFNLLQNFYGIQNKIDNTRYLLNNEF